MAARTLLLLDPRNYANPDVPNLGLAYAATHWQAPVIDQHIRVEPLDRVLEMEAETLGISVRSVGLREAKRLREAYQERYPQAQIRSVHSCLSVQCCYPFGNFEDRLEFSADFGDDLPFPDFDLFDSIEVLKEKWASGEWRYCLMTSHGCPFSCTYCAARETRWRRRSAENSVAELKQAKERWGIRAFQVIDDCFNASLKHALDFCEQVAPLGLPWQCANGLRADRFTEELAVALKRSGCQTLTFGVESADPSVLETIKKGETQEQISEAIAIAKRHFGAVAGFFILGLPGSSYRTDLNSIRFALRQGIAAHFSYYVPDINDEMPQVPFYGEGALPQSSAYPAHLQQRLYDLTAHWRPGGGAHRGQFLKLLWIADRGQLVTRALRRLRGKR